MSSKIPFTAVAVPSSSLPIKFLVNGAAINSAAPSRRFKHDGKWRYREPIKDGEAEFATKPIAELVPADVTWVQQDGTRYLAGRDLPPEFCPVPLKQHLLGVWRRGKDTFLALTIPDDVRPLVNVSETGGLVQYARFYQSQSDAGSSACFSTYTESNFPGGLDKSETEWNDAMTKFVQKNHPLELLWWRDEEAKATLISDLDCYGERYDAYIKACVKYKGSHSPAGIGIKILLGGEACCAMFSCEPCIVPVVECCNCTPYQHHWFFRWHGMEVTADPSATAAPTDAARVGTSTCHWSFAQCCCPLWPLLPCICMCVGAKE